MTTLRHSGTAVRRALTLGLAAGLWLTVAVPAGATGTLDAKNSTPTTSWLQVNGTMMLAQTFTALTTGQLDQVDLPLGGIWNAGGKIYIVPAGTTTAGQPSAMTSPSFGAYSGSMSCCSLFRSYPITPAYAVTANGHYAIVVVPNPGTSVMWAVVRYAAYPGGQVWMGNQPSTWTYMANMAFDFKTYVTAGSGPTPTITRVNRDVPVTEGTAPTNSGTFSFVTGLGVVVILSQTALPALFLGAALTGLGGIIVASSGSALRTRSCAKRSPPAVSTSRSARMACSMASTVSSSLRPVQVAIQLAWNPSPAKQAASSARRAASPSRSMRPSTASKASRLSARSSTTMSQRPFVVCSASTAGSPASALSTASLRLPSTATVISARM